MALTVNLPSQRQRTPSIHETNNLIRPGQRAITGQSSLSMDTRNLAPDMVRCAGARSERECGPPRAPPDVYAVPAQAECLPMMSVPRSPGPCPFPVTSRFEAGFRGRPWYSLQTADGGCFRG